MLARLTQHTGAPCADTRSKSFTTHNDGGLRHGLARLAPMTATTPDP
ncbi:hypothetical protein A2U01_0108728, partial [Trifolium medium]|nr:hypothetical protein [Trifolium medium]